MSDQPYVHGMGAIPYEGGCAFRVWAPHADYVAVKGDFNWWSDTHNPLHREGNGYWYTTVQWAHPGQRYKYRIANGWQHLDKIDPYARQVTHSAGDGVIYNHGWFDWQWDNFHLAGHNDLVIYEAHVGTLLESWGGGPGTFYQVIDKLAHLQHLGVNALQLMPIMEFPGDYSWGYNPSHLFAPKSSYGGPDGLKLLVREAHKRGIGVLLDVVYNHLGPNDLDLWRFDGWGVGDWGGVYFYNDSRAVTPWGNTRPDYGREQVRYFLHDNAKQWFYDYHVDGLRYDMTPFIRSVSGVGNDLPDGWDLIRWINLDTRRDYPGRITIAEDLMNDPSITGGQAHDLGFHTQWDAQFVHPVRRALQRYHDADRSMRDVAHAISARYNGDAWSRVIYTENHDEVSNGHARLVTEINPVDQQGWYAQKRSTLGAALVLTSPGVPMLFQGQEFLQDGTFRDDAPLNWWLNENYHGIVNLYRDLIALRHNWYGGTEGLKGQGVNVFHVNDWDKLIAFQRWSHHGPGDDVVVICNFSHHPRPFYQIGMPAAGQWRLRLNSDSRLYSRRFGDHWSEDVVAYEGGRDGLSAHATVSVGAYSTLIYSFEG